MSQVKPDDIKLFRWAGDLPGALWDDLQARSPQDAARANGAAWDGGRFRLTLVGREYLLDPVARQVTEAERPGQKVSYQAGLVLLTALSASKGAPPSGNMVTPQELPGGSLFFTGPHAINTGPLLASFGEDPTYLAARAEKLGGKAVPGGDCGVVVPGLPLVPLYVLIWKGDEEFAPQAVVGLDERAQYHLALDGIWALSNILIHRICGGSRG